MQEAYDDEQAEKLEKKLRKNEYTLEDFLEQMGQVKKMGGIAKMVEMLPGVGANKVKEEDVNRGEQEFRRMEAIIHSMTKAERHDPSILNASRRKRIAAGSGTGIQDVNQLLKQLEQSKEMMKQLKNKKGFGI